MTDQTLELTTPKLTTRSFAKFMANAAVQIQVASLTRSVIADRSSHSSTDIPVMLAGAAVGYVVGATVAPLTDLAVDKTADFIVAKREARKARKAEKAEKKTETK